MVQEEQEGKSPRELRAQLEELEQVVATVYGIAESSHLYKGTAKEQQANKFALEEIRKEIERIPGWKERSYGIDNPHQ